MCNFLLADRTKKIHFRDSADRWCLRISLALYPFRAQADSWQRPSVQPHAFFVSLVEHSLALLPAPTETVPGRALSHASDELTVQSCRLGTLRTESILTSNFFTLVCKKRKPLSCRVAGPGCVMILESQMLFLAECQGQTIQGTLVKEK